MNKVIRRKAMLFRPSDLLLERFSTKQGVSKTEAQKVFNETKKFLILCASNCGSGLSPSTTVDEMWHTFILFSRDYFKFCELIGAGYIHHDPSVKPQPNSYQKTFDGLQKLFGKIDLKYWSTPSDSCCNHSCKST